MQKLNWERETIRLLFFIIIHENKEAGFPASEPGIFFSSLTKCILMVEAWYLLLIP